MRVCSTPPTGVRERDGTKNVRSRHDSHTHKKYEYRAYFGWKEFWARPSCWNSACEYDSDDSTMYYVGQVFAAFTCLGLIGMTIVLSLTGYQIYQITQNGNVKNSASTRKRVLLLLLICIVCSWLSWPWLLIGMGDDVSDSVDEWWPAEQMVLQYVNSFALIGMYVLAKKYCFLEEEQEKTSEVQISGNAL